MREFLRLTATLALALALLASQSAPAAADHSSISGVVTNAKNGKPISGVCIQVGVDAPCWTYTDRNGSYFVDLAALAAPDGQYWQITFSRKSYGTTTSPVIYVDGPTIYNTTLSHAK